MRIVEVHKRQFDSPDHEVRALLDSFGRPGGLFQPGEEWLAQGINETLTVGVKTGHWPFKYEVQDYVPGESLGFTFLYPPCLKGATCRFQIYKNLKGNTVLVNTFEHSAKGPANISWPLVFKWLYQASIQDVLANAQRSLGEVPKVRGWSPWVNLLRSIFLARTKRKLILVNKAIIGE